MLDLLPALTDEVCGLQTVSKSRDIGGKAACSPRLRRVRVENVVSPADLGIAYHKEITVLIRLSSDGAVRKSLNALTAQAKSLATIQTQEQQLIVLAQASAQSTVNQFAGINGSGASAYANMQSF